MAGQLRHTGARIARRATAAGFSALAFALAAGFLSFMLTTSHAGQASESVARYLPNAVANIELRALSSERPRVAAASSTTPSPAGDTPFEATLSEDAEATHATLAMTDEAMTDEGSPAAVLDAAAAPASAQVPLRVEAPATPPLAPGDLVEVSVSFYYCEPGAYGDGGGFCGAMRNGTVVYPGAAACSYVYLGQRFRIVGDPLERVYRCDDTGSAVHGLHRDIWFMTSAEGIDWQHVVGQVATIEILP